MLSCDIVFLIKIVRALVKISSARRSKIRHKGENDAIKENLRESSVVKKLVSREDVFYCCPRKSCLVTFTKLKDSYFQFEQTHVISVEKVRNLLITHSCCFILRKCVEILEVKCAIFFTPGQIKANEGRSHIGLYIAGNSEPYWSVNVPVQACP